MPPDSSHERASSKPDRPKRSNSGRARSRASRGLAPAHSSASAAFASAVRHGSSRSRCGMYAAGSARADPASETCSPATSSSRVDLPQPDGPTTATSSPVRTDNETPSSATRSPKRRVTLLNSTTRSEERDSDAGASSACSIAPFAGITPTGSEGLISARSMRAPLDAPDLSAAASSPAVGPFLWCLAATWTPKEGANSMRLSRFAALLAAFVVLTALTAQSAFAASVTPTVVTGNPGCSNLDSSWTGLKIDRSNVAGDYSDGTLSFHITQPQNGGAFDWTSNIGVDAVIVKGGAGPDHSGDPGSTVYRYDPESTGDTGLEPPYDTGVSHVEFCYDTGDDNPCASGSDMDDDGIVDAC